MAYKILIVDDDEINRKILCKLLGSEYSVVEAEDGQEALSILRRRNQAFSAVLLDLVMPIMDGYEMMQQMQLSPILAQIPVIVTTANEDVDVEIKALDCGATDFLAKPYNGVIIRQRLKNLIRLRESSAIINHMQRDRLTGLYNREAFFTMAERMIAVQPEGYYVLGGTDVDNFKVINDQYGPEHGDEVLKCLANALQESCAQTGGLCGRIMADNFVALFPASLLETGDIGPQKLENCVLTQCGIAVALSVGRYIVDDKTIPVSAMYDRVCLAQRTVKGRYDAHIATYDETMREGLVREQAIVSEMRMALATGQFEAWFQPQYNHSTGALIGAEALARWRHPEWGLVSPAEFIPIFEKNGFVYELDKCIWRQVCAHLRRWLDEGRSPLPVSVNISRYDLFCDDLVPVITALVEHSGIAKELLRLEITESAFAQSTSKVIEVVKRLILQGFTVEIDDFGSGYSSLNTLKDVPAQILKLDMRFMENSGGTDRGGNILESVVRMAKWLGMSVIAEGVERIEQADYLKSIGCSYIQGFLYAKPMPVQEYEALARGVNKEERLLTMQTVENLDNNAFWSPESLDTLIFNSYVGAACIFEYHDGRIELLRATDKYARAVGNEGLRVEDALKIDWAAHMDKDTRRMVTAAVQRSIETREEDTNEYLFVDLPGCPKKVYLRSTLRVIAAAGTRYLIYCVVENVTAQRESERRERESAKKERETAQRLQTIMQSLVSGVSAATIDADNATHFLFANDRFYAMYGYTKEQFENELEDPFAAIHPEDRPGVIASVRNLLKKGGSDTFCYRCVKRTGELFTLRVYSSIVHLDGVEGDVVLAVSLDITKEQETLAKLRESEERFRIAIGMTDALIGRYDIHTREYTHNDKTLLKIGFPPVLKNAPESFIEGGGVAPESAEALREFYARIREGETPCHGEARLKMEDGAFHWCTLVAKVIFDESGKPSQAIIVTTDISEQREKEAAYKKWRQSISRRKPEDYTLFRCNLSKDTSFDSVEGELLPIRFDPRLARSFNENTFDYAGKFVHPDDRNAYVALLNSDTMLASYYRGLRNKSLDYRELLPDGGVRYLRVTIELIEYPASTDVEAYLLYENIDREKREQLLTKERAETDPLTGVYNRKTFAANFELLGKTMEPGTQNALLLFDVDGFKQLNDTFGHAAGDQALIDIATAVRGILRPVDLLGRLGGDEFLVCLKNMGNDIDVANKARDICSALRKSYRVDVHLTASVGIALFPRDGATFDEVYRKADAALYAVKKTGKNNFAFFQSGIDELKAEEEPAQQDASAETPKPREATKRRMLIVEDNPLDLELLSAMFKDEYLIDAAKDGSSALIRLRHYTTAISVVLLDLYMPGVDGFEVLEQMRSSEELRLIPVIVVSGSEDRETTLRAIRCGATDYITKPVDPDIINVRVHAAISRAENERLRAQNSFLSLQSEEVVKYRTALENTATVVILHDWKSGTFSYDASIGKRLAGNYDNNRRLWRIFLSDLVADAMDVQRMQNLVRDIADDRRRAGGCMEVMLKTPSGAKHRFRLHINKVANEYKLTDKLILTFTDLDEENA